MRNISVNSPDFLFLKKKQTNKQTNKGEKTFFITLMFSGGSISINSIAIFLRSDFSRIPS